MSSWLDYFIGSSQSRYAFFAIFSALVAICMAIIFTNSDISIVNRMIIVVFVLFVSIFPVAISLFELTCMVNGGKSKNGIMNPCSTYAWIVTAMIVIYCFFLIIATIISMFTYKKAIAKVEQSKQSNVISSKDANTIAKNIIVQEEQKETFVEKPPVSQGIPSMPSGMPPASEGLLPVSETMPPASQGMPPVSQGMPPTPSGGMPSASQGMPSASQGMPSASQGMPPTPSGGMPSASKMMMNDNQLSDPVGNSDDTFAPFAPVMSSTKTIETFKQQGKKHNTHRNVEHFKQQEKKNDTNEIMGYDAQDDFMTFNTKETFVNAPSAKKPVKKMQKAKPNFTSPKPFTKQIETFANI